MRQNRWTKVRSRTAAAATMVALVFTSMVALAAPATAAIQPATLTVEKTGPSGDDLPLVPGEPFTYVITVQCSYVVPNAGCYNASVTDTIPPPLELAGNPAVVSSGNTASVSTDGNSFSVDFVTTFLDPTDPGVGMLGGTTATITVPVVVPEDVNYDVNGLDIVNTAEFAADNPDTPSVTDDHTVVIEVPLELDTDITKSFDPSDAVASNGAETTVTIDASNGSGTGVESLTVTEPAPGSGSTTFDYLALSSLTVTSVPAGADQIVVSVDTGSGLEQVALEDVASLSLPYSVDLSAVALEDVVGIQVSFLDDDGALIEDGAGTQIQMGLTQRDPGELTDSVVVDNTVLSEVSRDGESESSTGDADYSITTNIPTVSAGKEFEDDWIVHGDTSTANLTAGVEGDLDLETLAVTEPGTGQFTESMTFEGFDGGVTYPAGADSASITYTTSAGTFGPMDFADGAVPPLPDDGSTVLSFTITFVDDDASGITAGGSPASIPVIIGTDPDDTSAQIDVINDVSVTGTTPEGVTDTDTADDTVFVYDEHLDSTTTKSIAPGVIEGYPGEWIVMQLSGGTAGEPADGATDDPYSTSPADTIVISDPVDPPDPFWSAFHPTQIVDVNVPPDVTLTVQYWNGTDWVDLPGAVFDNSDSPVTFDLASSGIDPADMGGLRFVYEDESGAGFPPGTSFQPNVVMEFDPDTADTSAWADGDPAVFTNCTTASAENDAVASGDAPPACDDVSVLDPDDDGDGPTMDKTFVNPDGSEDPSIPARSHQTTTARLAWSTGGVSNVRSLTLQDEAGTPPASAAALADSVYDTFDLVQIGPATDPLLQYDAIDAVLIYDGTAWVAPTDSPCDAVVDGAFTDACAGQLPVITLTDTERATTVGVRVVYTEGTAASRAGAVSPSGDPVPPVGSGVARSDDSTGRTLDLTYRVRDWLRSDTDVPVDGLSEYNGAGTGVVNNAASATSVFDDGESTVGDNTNIVISSPDLQVATTKSWDGSPVGVPPTGTAADDYPHTAVSLSVTNDSSIVYVDELALSERPTLARPVDDPVLMPDVFDISGIDAITLPSGADGYTFTMFDDAGAVVLDSDVDGVPTGWTQAEMADVVGFSLVFHGRDGDEVGGPGDPTTGGIEPNATGTVRLSLQLRSVDRYRGVAIDEAYLENYGTLSGDPEEWRVPVGNVVTGTVDDAGRNPAVDPEPPSQDANAEVELVGFDIGVAVDKTFSNLDGTGETDDYSQLETVDGAPEPFLMHLTVTPTGGARPVLMQVSDLDPTFWNAYEFVGLGDGFTLSSPIDQVGMQWCTEPLSGDMNGPISGGCEREVNGDESVVYTGALEQTGLQDSPADLVITADYEDITGVVFTFQSGSAWEDPWNPVQEVPIVVQRRETLLTPAGEPVPTDLDGNLAAPGEDAAGVTRNTAQAVVKALLDVTGSPEGEGIHAIADPDADATVTYEHSITAADVVKTPDGGEPLSLGAPTTFSLAFTNTGDTPLYNPVFTDTLPVDADGPILEIDTTPTLTGGSPYGFTLDTSAGEPLPAGWGALPEDEAQITMTPAPSLDDAETLTFTFPDGTALGVGETYTITVQMYVRAGFDPSVFFTNTASVSGDRPFDYCDAGPFDPDDAGVLEQCDGDATNAVAEGGAIRSGKFVRAGGVDDPDYTFGAVNTVDPAAECTVNTATYSEGFWTSPCVPRTAPGQTETWRLVLQNTGNVGLSELIVVDRVPDVGDGTALNPSVERGSLWKPVVTNVVAGTVGPAGATIDAYVTEDVEPCVEVIQHTGDCGDAWTLLEDYAGAPEDVNGIMYIVTMANGAVIEPGEVVTLDVESTTPATAPSLTDPATSQADPIAWNTVATSGTSETGANILATEGNIAGVALVTGSIAFSKDVTGESAAYAPDTFDVTVVCTSLGEEVFNETYTVAADDAPVQIDNLPYGAECTLEEGDEGQWTSTVIPDSVTVPDGTVDNPAVLLITNDYPVASLRLTKEVVGDGTGSSADPTQAGPFTLGALCRFEGDVVFATNTTDYTVMSGLVMQVTDMRHEDSVLLEGLPAGTECIAGELDPADADRVAVVWDTAGEGTETPDGAVVGDPDDGLVITGVFTLTPDDPQGEVPPATTNEVLVLNQYASGELTLLKELEGPAADAHLEDTFTVDVLCVYQREGEDDVVTFDGAVDITPGTEVTIDSIIVGSECTVTEPEDGRGGADQWVLSPADGDDPTTAVVTVTGTGEDAVEVTITNRFEELVDLDVTKVVDDSALTDGQGGIPDVGPFPVAVTCVYEEGTPYERTIHAAGYGPLRPMRAELSDGEVWLLEDMPTGTVCTVTETDAAGAIATTAEAENADGTTGPVDAMEVDIVLTPNGLLGRTTNHVTFVNAFPVGALNLTKELTGEGVEERGEGPFRLHVVCVSDEFGVDTYEADVVLGGDQPLTATIDGILAPSDCTVTETEAAGADGVLFTPGEPGDTSATVEVTADAEAAASVTVTNHFEPYASLAVTKSVDPAVTGAEGEPLDLGPYVVIVECVYDPEGPDEHEVYADGYGPSMPMVAVLDDGETVTFTGIPATSECTVTETYAGGASSTTVTVASADVGTTTVDGAIGTVTLTPGDTTTALVTNTFEVGSLAMEKVVGGDGADEFGAGPFEFSVVCTWERDGRDAVVTWDGAVTLGGAQPLETQIDGIVAGSVCVVTETDAGGANDTRLTPAGSSSTEAVVTIGAGVTVSVMAYNQFDATPPPAGGGVDGDSGFLPITGFDNWAIAIIALALLAVGAAIAIIARRRR